MKNRFVHTLYRQDETIAAIATAPGEGGIAVVRISGATALSVSEKVFSGPVHSYKSHTAHYGNLCDAKGNIIDDVLLLVMLGKRSYTGEDTVEVHCHGGSAVTRRVLEVILEAGARAAQPGEFTFRAFMNGRLDLAQAEAVQSLIGAKGDKAMEAAREQLEGRLSRHIATLQSSLTDIAAILEAWVDFPDEGLEFASLEELIARLEEGAGEMSRLLATFHDGKMLQEGIALCLIGSPNVGKSSLMNALLDKERAIVSPFAGTTRDIVEDQFRLNGLHVRLIDTAGIRIAQEAIEQEGIRRSRDALGAADLVLFVLDSHRGMGSEDRQLYAELPREKSLAVWNKRDLSSTIEPLDLPAVAVSALTREGLDELKAQIDAIIWKRGAPQRDEVMLTHLRHKEALEEALTACCRVIDALRSGLSPEFAALDMRSSLLALGKIIGSDVTEDVLSAIFSTFCIGK